MSLDTHGVVRIVGSFPRSRGDEPFALADGLTLEEFSPLTRG